MKKRLTGLFTIFSVMAMAQAPSFPDPSPQVRIFQEIGNTNMRLQYSRPAVRGRKIFGDLVPFGKLWRTGAAESSKLSFDKEVTIAGEQVAPGNYSLLTIPGENSWEIILNSDTTLYGIYGYDETRNVARFSVPSEKSDELIEAFTIDLQFIPNDAKLTIGWEHTRVSFLIETSTNEDMEAYIRTQLLTRKDQHDDNYISAASFLLMNNLNIEQAFLLSTYALEIKDSEYVRNVRSSVLEKMGKTQEAKQEVFAAMQLVRESAALSEKDKKDSLQFWENRLAELN